MIIVFICMWLQALVAGVYFGYRYAYRHPPLASEADRFMTRAFVLGAAMLGLEIIGAFWR